MKEGVFQFTIVCVSIIKSWSTTSQESVTYFLNHIIDVQNDILHKEGKNSKENPVTGRRVP
jgi:hypothetical protein